MVREEGEEVGKQKMRAKRKVGKPCLLFFIFYFLWTPSSLFMSDMWGYHWKAYSQVERLTSKNTQKLKYAKMLPVRSMKNLNLSLLLFCFAKCPHWVRIHRKNILETYITMGWWEKHLCISLESHESFHKMKWLHWKLKEVCPGGKGTGWAF